MVRNEKDNSAELERQRKAAEAIEQERQRRETERLWKQRDRGDKQDTSWV